MLPTLQRGQSASGSSECESCRARPGGAVELAANSSRHKSTLSRFFMGVAQGLNVVNKVMADPGVLRDIARLAMSVWDTAGDRRRRAPRPAHRAKAGRENDGVT